ncbi:MAG: Fe-S protein assembly co-chaperone HscB [Candidatus Berkiella sp.]
MDTLDYFTLFGVEPIFTQDLAVLKARHLELQQKMHPDNFANALANERRLATQYAAWVNEAYQILCDPLERAIYLLDQLGVDVDGETDTQMPNEFLSMQMDLHEELENISSESERITFENKVNEAWQACEKGLAKALDSTPKGLSDARMWVRKMQFYAKLRQEAEVCLS